VPSRMARQPRKRSVGARPSTGIRGGNGLGRRLHGSGRTGLAFVGKARDTAVVSAAAHQSERLRLLVVADHHLFAEMLMASLSTDERIDVVGTAKTGEEAIELVDSLEPDIVLMDLWPILDRVGTIRELRERGSATRILVLTGSDSPEIAAVARSAGADGFVSKDQDASELRESFFEAAWLTLAFGGGVCSLTRS
jgi:CheY-like chemotaxis protein